VDDYDELLWRLRALNGVKGIRGKRVVCIGGAAGWGARGREAPARAADLWGMEFAEVSYEELGARIDAARGDRDLVDRCVHEAQAYLDGPGVTLLPLQEELTTAELLAGMGRKETLDEMRGFVERAFILTEVFKDLMAEHETDAITVAQCMGAILPVAETTACLTLTLLNDSGCLAFCESDYGAAPRVEMRRGQELTVLVPNFANSRWIGFRGRILEKPTLDICTSQLDVGVDGECARLADEMGGFHWMLCYGDYLRETGYALRKAGIEWLNLSEKAP